MALTHSRSAADGRRTAYGSAHSDITHCSRELQALASSFEEVGNYPECVREGETTGHCQDRQRSSGRRPDVLAEKVKKELIGECIKHCHHARTQLMRV